MVPVARSHSLATLALLLLAIPAAWSQHIAKPAPDEQTGLPIGAKAPDFLLEDQNGNKRSLESFLKKRKVALVFYRSADW